jgi:hypothetical protein
MIPCVVGALERAPHLSDHARRIRDRQNAKARETFVERLALEQLHDDVGAAVLEVPWSKIWMACFDWIVAAARASLSKPAPRFLVLRLFGLDELDGDASSRASVPPFPHRSHAAAPDEPEDLVLALRRAPWSADRAGSYVDMR